MIPGRQPDGLDAKAEFAQSFLQLPRWNGLAPGWQLIQCRSSVGFQHFSFFGATQGFHGCMVALNGGQFALFRPKLVLKICMPGLQIGVLPSEFYEIVIALLLRFS